MHTFSSTVTLTHLFRYGLFRSGATVKPNTDFEKVMGKPMTRFEDRMKQMHEWGVL